ncbi:MAG TPA: PASTA domain-containing protein [Solirubrobacteraceae bacterium]|jgi:serine/threonine-protein kinase
MRTFSRRRVSSLGAVFVACAVVLALLATTVAAAPAKKHCKVPNLVGKTKKQAKQKLRKANCTLGAVTKQKSPTVAKGKIISTSPKAGTKRKAGAAVNLKISSGAPKVKKQCTVPNVVGQSQSAAEAAINAAGCKVGTIKQKQSSTVPAGNVISTSPKAGKKAKVGKKVNLTVSSGAKASCTVPNVVGQSQSAAEAAINAAGCTVGKVKQKASSKVAKGNVISTSPKAGKKVKAGAKVNLTVSSGPKSKYPVPKP